MTVLGVLRAGFNLAGILIDEDLARVEKRFLASHFGLTVRGRPRILSPLVDSDRFKPLSLIGSERAVQAAHRPDQVEPDEPLSEFATRNPGTNDEPATSESPERRIRTLARTRVGSPTPEQATWDP